MPFDRDVTIDFNADISGYSASMGQLIQQTSQYSAAADGMIGKIAKLNNVTMAGVKSLSAFTQTNKVATAQAAAYQQQLSKIETSAKVNNKSFTELEKTTKGLAKDFPIGMKQAVEQVESLQEAGVTTNKEISQLAKTFTKLGAATGTFGPEMGKNMLQLNRTFENGTDSMEKYADSLTTVTHLYGANAGAVTSFAKSIAPVAATVGMSETSVIGLSTAFSRLGEDGFAAANTFNKVMLDMSKSIREGTPEAKIYAEVMGTTADNLKKTWESNPAEGFIDFVEAIKKQGAGGIRSLEQLGLEGVRTQKTIMALANSGNMREIVEKAQSSYGSGMTGTAAETAMGGVNDQLTMLNETMAQTTATAGKPFLGFLEQVLKVANSISKVFADLVESPVVQGMAKAIGIGGGVFGITKLLNSVMPTIAMGHLGARAAGGRLAELRAGRAEGLTGVGDSLARRIGAYMRVYGGGVDVDARPLGQRVRGGLRTLSNVGGNVAALSFRSSETMMLRAMGEEGLATEEGKRFVAAMDDLKNIDKSLPRKERRALAKAAAGRATEAVQDMAMLEGGVGRAMKAYASQTRTSIRYAGSLAGMGMRGLGAVGGQMAGAVGLGGLGLGATAALGGVGIAAGAGYMLYQSRKKEDEAQERGGKDAYRMFNEFAEKAGIATKGLVSFAEAINESTSTIAAESDSREDAYKLTEKERIQAQTPGYERAYTTRGGSFWDKALTGPPSAEKEALRVRGMLGSNASPEAINRVQMDLANQFGSEFAQSVMTNLSGLDKKSSKEIEEMLSGAGDKSRAVGIFGTTESAEFKEMAEAERARRVNLERSVMGTDVQQAKQFAGGETGLAGMQAISAERRKEQESTAYAMGTTAGATQSQVEESTKAMDSFIDSLELTSQEAKAVRRTYTETGGLTAQGAAMDLGQLFEASGLTEKATAWRQGTAAEGEAAGGYAKITPEKMAEMALSPMEKAAKDSVDQFDRLHMETGTLVTDMAGTAKAYRDWTKTADGANKTFEEWVDAGSKGATDLQKAYAEVKMAPGDAAKQAKLTDQIVQNAVKQAVSAGTGTVGAQNIITAAMTTETGEELPALQAARQETAVKMQLAKPESTLAQQQATIKQGQIAEARLMNPNITASARQQAEQEKAAGLQAQTSRMQQMQQFMLQMRRSQEDYNLQRSHMERDFEKQQAYAAQDYGRQRKYMIQDYHQSVLWAEEDFYKQRRRAQRDFDKQITRQAEETAKNMMDPYQRIGPQMVTDMGMVMQSLIEQNKSVSDQLSSVQRLSNMGLSKDAIDQLKLMDPTQNQQVQRMLADAMTNPGGIGEINKLVEERLRLGYKLTTSDFNKGFQNMKEDFGQSMEDMSEDFEQNMDRGEKRFKQGLKRNAEAFATAQSRAADAHQTALDDMAEANETAITRAQEDLTGMADEFTTNYADIQTKFLKSLADLPSNLSKSTKTAITNILQDEIDAIDEANTKGTNAAKGKVSQTMVYVVGQGWVPMGGAGDMQEPEAEQGKAAAGNSPLGTKRTGQYHAWRSYSGGGFHGGADIGHRGGGAFSVVNGTVKFSGVARGGDRQNPSGSYGRHVIITDGQHDFLYGHLAQRQVSTGQKVSTGDRIGTIGNTGNTRPIGSGYHLHFEVRPHDRGHSSAVDPNPWLAEGGVVTRHIRPHVGEGGPEAVIPLNERGAQYLADALSKSSFARYWQSHDAKKTFVGSHSSPVTNNVYTYDQRTQFSGEVHVESQDPEDMARKLAQRERRNRLARKQGSAA